MTSNLLRLVVVAVGVAVAVAVGTGQIAKGPENERPEERGTAAGLTTYAVPLAAFTIAVPESWRVLKADEVFGDEEALDQFLRENPGVAAYRDAFTDPRSPVKLVAADPRITAGFATNLNVIAQEVPDGFSFQDFVNASDAELDSLANGGTNVERDVVDLPAGSALQVSYRNDFRSNGGVRSVNTLQYGLVANGRSYILTYTTLPELAAAYADDFERSAHSFAATAD